MPANTVRVPLPRSSVSFRSLSAPSMCSALTILAMRRSTLEKSSIEIVPSVAGREASSSRLSRCRSEQRVELFCFDALH